MIQPIRYYLKQYELIDMITTFLYFLLLIILIGLNIVSNSIYFWVCSVSIYIIWSTIIWIVFLIMENIKVRKK